MSEESADLVQGELFWTNTSQHARWYLERRILPGILYWIGSIVVIAAMPPWGEVTQAAFSGMGMMVVGALAWEACKYQPWRDA